MARNRRRIDRSEAAADFKEKGSRLLRAVLALATAGATATGAVYAGTWLHHWATTSPEFEVTTIEVKGNRRAGNEELLRLSGLAVGRNLFTSDLDGAVSGISGQPWVKEVSVRRAFPHTIRVEVKEREPRLLVALDKLYFADTDGSLFKRALAGDDLDLPVVTGLSRESYRDHREQTEARLRGLIELAQSYEERQLAQRAGRLEELSVDEDEGVTLHLGKGPVAVKLGEAPFEEKLDRLSTLWGEFERRGVQPQVVHLDNRSRPGWVAVKLADATVAQPPAKSGKKP
jgi:cell division protein FtsQ